MIGDAKSVADHVRCRVYRGSSDIDLLGDLYRVIDLDAEIANGALDLRVAQQELNRPEIARSPVDQHGLRAAKGVRTKLGRVEPDAGHPLLHEPSILPGGQAA